jgi:hypothetical protein
MKRLALLAALLLLTAATFPYGRITHLSYDTGPYIGSFHLSEQGITLEGDGVIGEDVGLRYPPDANGNTADSTCVYLEAPHIALRDLVISGPMVNGSWGRAAGLGDGIRFDGASVPQHNRVIWATVLDHVSVLYAGRSCLRIDPGKNPNGSAGYWVSPSLRDCNFYGAMGDGVWVSTVTDADWTRCTSSNNGGWSYYFDGIQTSRFKIAAESSNGGIYLRNGEACVFEACHVEEFAGHSVRPGLVLDNCHGVTVQGCSFASWNTPGTISISLINGTSDCIILPNFHAQTAIAVKVDASCKNNTIYAQSQYNYGNTPTRGLIVASRKRNKVIE